VGAAVAFTVFTKPWKESLEALGERVSRLGFAGIELPVRAGYPVDPDNVTRELPRAAQLLAGYGLRISSVAGPTDEATIAACGEAGVPIIRICPSIPRDRGYLEQEAKYRHDYELLAPLLDRHGVAIGIQNHNGRSVPNALGILHLIEGFDPRHVCVVWDPAHCALDGELPELAIDILWSHLRLVNLKNGLWQRTNGPEAEVARYQTYWTSGRQGLCHWPDVVAQLQRRGYQGDVCLTAEYSDHDAVDRLIAEDLAFARSLFGA
jgi:sugar phosphate isomerase/epimerase